MPIYEYQCKACGAVSEIITNVSAHSDSLTCKSCGSTELSKIAVSSVAANPSRASCRKNLLRPG